MSFSESRFAEIRPYLYHSTSIRNLAAIRDTRKLRSASALSDHTLQNTDRRVAPTPVGSAATVWLQTQRPLHKGNIALEGGFSFSDLVCLLNSKVFFWPGSENGPIPHGQRHLAGNDWRSAAATLRVPTRALMSQNSRPAMYCAYNSGSPRCVGGRKSPRGPGTFASAGEFERTAGDVIEVVFSDEVELPNSTQRWDVTNSRWISLFRS